MKRMMLLGLICLLLLSGCGGVSLKKEKMQQDENGCLIRSELLMIDGLADTEREQALNQAHKAMLNQWIADFSERIAALGSSGETPELTVEEEDKRCDANIISTVCQKYLYTGVDAHGNLWQSSRNIYVPTGEELTLSALFNEDDFEKFLNQRITEVVEANPSEYADLWEKPAVTDASEKDFYLTDKELVLYYQPYALSYYARGVVEIPIRLETLRGYLNQDIFTG